MRRWPAVRLLVSLLPAFVGGAVAALSVPPWGFWVLAPLGIAGLAISMYGARARRRAAAGLAFGVGLFGPTLFWMSEFTLPGYLIAWWGESAFIAAAMLLVPPRKARVLALPAGFVLAEWARGEVPFGGVPIGGLPLGQAGSPVVPAARIGGALLLLGLVAAVGVAIAPAIARLLPLDRIAIPDIDLGARTAAVAGVTVAAGVLLAAVGSAAPAGKETDRIDVAVVQGGGERGFRAVEGDSAEVLAAHLEISESLEPPLDLVVWPENAIDVVAIDDSPVADALAAIARTVDATVVAGVTEDANGGRNFHNVAVAWDPRGRIVDRYVKVIRVPFGEYVPGRSLIERVADLTPIPRDAVAGRGAGLLRTPAGRLGVAISWEVFFTERGRSATRAGAEVLLVPTNAASFSTGQVPAQEVAAAQLRAWESGRWLIQSAPTGYGAVIDERGRIRARTTLGEAEILAEKVVLRTGRTPYVAWGDVPLLALCLVVAVGVWLVQRPRDRRFARATDPSHEADGRGSRANVSRSTATSPKVGS